MRDVGEGSGILTHVTSRVLFVRMHTVHIARPFSSSLRNIDDWLTPFATETMKLLVLKIPRVF